MARPLIRILPLGFPWETADPFLFCVHHDDAYPRGNGRAGPLASLAGRTLGNDFEGRDGWRMYHGTEVPGFPAHPHRGFETVTIVRHGLVDHSDSLGAAARFGRGDVQWLTAGAGIVHSEMFPLLDTEGGNRLELFQIWLNLPAKQKMSPPHFTMFWGPRIPRLDEKDEAGRSIEVAVIAGALPGADAPLAPPPDSWASDPRSDLAIWTIRLEPGAKWSLPAARGEGTRRMLYVFEGQGLRIAGEPVGPRAAVELQADVQASLHNGEAAAELLMLQARPIGEPVAQYGPFVMNRQQELHEAFADYRRTGFGGWPWPGEAPVHGDAPQRFARHADGRVEQAP